MSNSNQKFSDLIAQLQSQDMPITQKEFDSSQKLDIKSQDAHCGKLVAELQSLPIDVSRYKAAEEY